MMSARDPPPNLVWNNDGQPQFTDDRFKNVKADAQDLTSQMMSKPEKRIKLEGSLFRLILCRIYF